jgi:PAS domain S-box-containing protein
LYESQQKHAAALEHSKGLLQSIIDSSNAFIVVTNLEGQIITANRPFTELIGERLADVVGRPAIGYSPSWTSKAGRHHGQVIATAVRSWWRRRSRSADPAHVLLSRFLLRESDGAPYAVCTIATEITPIKRAEEERRVFAEQLQHTQKLESLGVLAGGIAHDFNNLLTSILGHASLVLEELPASSGRPETSPVSSRPHSARRR